MTPSGIEPATFRLVAQSDSAKHNVLVYFVTSKGISGRKTFFLVVAPNIVSIIIAVPQHNYCSPPPTIHTKRCIRYQFTCTKQKAPDSSEIHRLLRNWGLLVTRGTPRIWRWFLRLWQICGTLF
jgi:hypothetical protein